MFVQLRSHRYRHPTQDFKGKKVLCVTAPVASLFIVLLANHSEQCNEIHSWALENIHFWAKKSCFWRECSWKSFPFSALDSLDHYLSLSWLTLVALEMAVSPCEHCSNFSVIHMKQRAVSSGLTCSACKFRRAIHILPCTSLCTKCPSHRLQGIHEADNLDLLTREAGPSSFQTESLSQAGKINYSRPTEVLPYIDLTCQQEDGPIKDADVILFVAC